jgi:hypothetical protein
MVDTQIANYDPFLFTLGLLSALVFLFPFRVPRREHAGIQKGEKEETLGHYLEEGSATYAAHDGFLGITFDGKARHWWGGKLKCCRPFDHAAWYHTGAIAAMGMVFTVHFVYYFHRFGSSGMQHIDNLVWISWGCGMIGAFFSTFKGYFHDVGFALATWITTAIWLLKVIDVDWPAAGELAFVTVAGVMAIVFLSICVFCGICGVCAITCCTCRCCHDEISHKATKLFLRFNMHACIAMAIVFGFNIPISGIGHYLDDDRTWLLNVFYEAVGIFVAGVFYRLLFWHKGSGCCGACTCCSYCYEHFYDEKKHLWGDIVDNEAFCCYCCEASSSSESAGSPPHKGHKSHKRRMPHRQPPPHTHVHPHARVVLARTTPPLILTTTGCKADASIPPSQQPAVQSRHKPKAFRFKEAEEDTTEDTALLQRQIAEEIL